MRAGSLSVFAAICVAFTSCSQSIQWMNEWMNWNFDSALKAYKVQASYVDTTLWGKLYYLHFYRLKPTEDRDYLYRIWASNKRIRNATTSTALNKRQALFCTFENSQQPNEVSRPVAFIFCLLVFTPERPLLYVSGTCNLEFAGSLVPSSPCGLQFSFFLSH